MRYPIIHECQIVFTRPRPDPDISSSKLRIQESSAIRSTTESVAKMAIWTVVDPLQNLHLAGRDARVASAVRNKPPILVGKPEKVVNNSYAHLGYRGGLLVSVAGG